MKFLILALATWRMTSLFVVEEGPFEVFSRLRHLLGVRYDDLGILYGTNWFARGLACFWCASVWFGILWGGFYLLWPEAVYVALPFALSAVAVLMDVLINR